MAKPKKKKGGGGGGGGGGFGTSSNSTPSSSSGKKVRSMSGFAGSGTKALRVAANTFDSIRKDYGIDGTSDVYVRSIENDPTTFWFVGKVARIMDLERCQGQSIPTIEETILSQKRLILEYAKSELRPQNLGGPFAKSLELWYAPGDSEMDVVRNIVTLTKVDGSTGDISDTFSVADAGYNPEIYVGDEINEGGLRVKRDDEGKPVKPVFDINA